MYDARKCLKSQLHSISGFNSGLEVRVLPGSPLIPHKLTPTCSFLAPGSPVVFPAPLSRIRILRHRVKKVSANLAMGSSGKRGEATPLAGRLTVRGKC